MISEVDKRQYDPQSYGNLTEISVLNAQNDVLVDAYNIIIIIQRKNIFYS